MPVRERDTPNLKYWTDKVAETFYKRGFDSRAFPMHLPNSNVFYVVHGDIYTDFVDNPKIQRLKAVRSLGCTDLGLDHSPCNQNRMQHSVIGAIMGERVLRTHNASDHDINLVILSMLAHDAATPPLSEWGKLACPEELDEEENLGFYLDGSFNELFGKYGIARGEVLDAVKGRGIVGKLVNSRGVDLDKIAYVAVDFVYAAGGPEEAKKAMWQDKDLIDIYEDIRLQDGEVVFADPGKLNRFLLVRAHMFNKVYLSHGNRLRAAQVKGVLQDLWKGGVLTKERMLQMHDYELWTVMAKEAGFGHTDFAVGCLAQSDFEEVGRYKSRQEAEQAGQGNGFLVDPFPPSFNPATSTLTIKDGEIVVFRYAFPERAAEIEGIAEESNYVGVYKAKDGTTRSPS